MDRKLSQRLLIQEMQNFSRKLRAQFDASVREKGLTLSRVRVLYTLLDKDGQTQRDLAAELEIETPTLVRLLDSMEQQGLIERRALESDRRAKQIFMTPAGATVAAEMSVVADHFRDRLMAGMGDAEIESGILMVRQLLVRLMEMGDGGKGDD